MGYRLASDPLMPATGDLVAERYRVEAAIAEGGFAAVFSANDSRTGQRVALKVLDPLLSRRPDVATRFERELLILTRLRHPNTVRVYDAGRTESGCLFLAMELLDGESAASLLARSGPLGWRHAGEIALEVLRSLAEAHDAGVVHRDLKPSNIFLARVGDDRPTIKVLDFGIAKIPAEEGEDELTQTGELLCSPYYVAPERVRTNSALPTSDLYSLGIILIELISGERPYVGATPMAISMQHGSPEPVPISSAVSSTPLGAVVARACSKDPSDRFPSARAMLAELQRALADGDRVVAAPERAPRRGIAMALAGVLLLGSLAALALRTDGSSAPPAKLSDVAPPAAAFALADAVPEAAPEAVSSLVQTDPPASSAGFGVADRSAHAAAVSLAAQRCRSAEQAAGALSRALAESLQQRQEAAAVPAPAADPRGAEPPPERPRIGGGLSPR